MNIMLYEFKKIWSWKIVGVLIMITAIFYQMFLYYPIEIFRLNHPQIEIHDYTVEMAEEYGVSITGEEIESFVSQKRPLYEQELDQYFEELSVFKAAGLSSYEEFMQFENNLDEELTEEDFDALMAINSGELTNYVAYRLQALDYLTEELSYVEGPNNIMSSYAFESTMSYIGHLSILVVLLSLILAAPVVIRDRMKNMHYLHYTSKNGRKIIGQQLKAVLVSGLILTTICIIVFGGLILRNDLLVFWDSPVNSFLNRAMQDILFDLTFGEYLSISIIFIYLLNVSVTFLAFTLSRFSQNMITLIMKLVPLFAVLTVLCTILFAWMFTPANQFYGLIAVDGIEGIVLVTFLTIATIISIYVLKREKRIDVL